ncbi:chloride channel protein, CIC family [Limimonas halophila]|uniref:Chloride channel protein, CIC family n=1 Tax=Limimonas halophila TaxID=1082479 RepID=A0A1G7M8R1_9PROT|nr:chloride channel protein [Limimonas halophila]SDF57580.1 chloride channel protein, CIC family [Limimonas halophila]
MHIPHAPRMRRWLMRLTSKRAARHERVLLLVLAVVVGAAAGAAAVLFRLGIEGAQSVALGFPDAAIAALVVGQPWWRILLAPVVGGLIVGIFVHRFMPDRRPQAVPEVIDAASDPNRDLGFVTGLKAAAVNVVSIGFGGSVGREGPMVHLGAMLGNQIARWQALGRASTRTLLGCGVAAGVAASFNAPIAGVFFALEVVLGHYAMRAFIPIVIASVTGTMISRAYFGGHATFQLIEQYSIASSWEFLAYPLLGVASGLTAIALIFAVMNVRPVLHRLRLPVWLHPAAGGVGLGVIAVLGLPHVLGVGYHATNQALAEAYAWEMLLLLAGVKVFATGISLGTGWGGGVFSPALFIGAMLGGAFGIGVAEVTPGVAASHGGYAVVGMGAVAGSVLGAPISTILMIFELTGNYELTVAVMFATVIANELATDLYARSLFQKQLSHRGVTLRGGEEDAVLHGVLVRRLVTLDCATAKRTTPVEELRAGLHHSRVPVVFVLDDRQRLQGVVTVRDLANVDEHEPGGAALTAGDIMERPPPLLTLHDDLAQALDLFGLTKMGSLPVVEDRRGGRFIGALRGEELMRAYHDALRQVREEEHG